MWTSHIGSWNSLNFLNVKCATIYLSINIIQYLWQQSVMVIMKWALNFKYNGANCCFSNKESAYFPTQNDAFTCMPAWQLSIIIPNSVSNIFSLWHKQWVNTDRQKIPLTTSPGHPSPFSAVLSRKSAAILVWGLYLCLFWCTYFYSRSCEINLWNGLLQGCTACAI